VRERPQTHTQALRWSANARLHTAAKSSAGILGHLMGTWEYLLGQLMESRNGFLFLMQDFSLCG